MGFTQSDCEVYTPYIMLNSCISQMESRNLLLQFLNHFIALCHHLVSDLRKNRLQYFMHPSTTWKIKTGSGISRTLLRCRRQKRNISR
jgi:hypothetical protein